MFKKAQELLKSHIKRTQGQVLHTSNKYGFRLKGIIRCDESGSAVCGYIKHKKNGKVYRYYKCLNKVNGIPAKCGISSIGADKLEEFIIEQLSIFSWNREFLEALVNKTKELSQKRIIPLKQEKQQIEARLSSIKSSIDNLIEPAKKTKSQNVTEELNKLEQTKRTLESKILEIQTELSYCSRTIYDIDVIESTLKNLSKHIYKLPMELQIRTIQLIIRQVFLFKDKIRLELYELPIEKINQIIEAKYTKMQTGSNQGEGSGRKLNKTDWRTKLVAVDNNWRGGRKLNKTTKNLESVPDVKNTYFIYTFLIDIPVIYQRITNGEKVLIQPYTTRNLNCHHLNSKSSNPAYLNQTRLTFDWQ